MLHPQPARAIPNPDRWRIVSGPHKNPSPSNSSRPHSMHAGFWSSVSSHPLAALRVMTMKFDLAADPYCVIDWVCCLAL